MKGLKRDLRSRGALLWPLCRFTHVQMGEERMHALLSLASQRLACGEQTFIQAKHRLISV